MIIDVDPGPHRIPLRITGTIAVPRTEPRHATKSAESPDNQRQTSPGAESRSVEAQAKTNALH